MSARSVEELGSLVAAHRRDRGLSLRRAAEETGVAFNTLARIEKGHVPDLATFLQFDLSAGRLRFGDGTDSVNFNFTEISAVIVPLPPAVWAGLAGLVLVVGVRRLGWLF